MSNTTILAISGSLRGGSLNTALIHAAQRLAPAGTTVDIYAGLAEIPPYNEDHDGDRTPAQVAELRALIDAADGLLIAAPEYNYSIPGVLKNALDWASRPNPGACLVGKPVAIMGASPGNFGTARGQLALRQILHATHSHVLPPPELLVFGAHQRYDGEGNLTDVATLGFLENLLVRLRDEIHRRDAHTPATLGAAPQ